MEKSQDKGRYPLLFELVPDGCWYSNLRRGLPPALWREIQLIARVNSNGKCAICGAKGVTLDTHEQWEYDEQKHVQSLKNIVAICRPCHSVKHIGFTQLKGNEQAAIKHFMKVNGCSYADYIRELGRANEEHRRRNQISEWQLDLSFLEEFLKGN